MCQRSVDVQIAENVLQLLHERRVAPHHLQQLLHQRGLHRVVLARQCGVAVRRPLQLRRHEVVRPAPRRQTGGHGGKARARFLRRDLLRALHLVGHRGAVLLGHFDGPALTFAQLQLCLDAAVVWRRFSVRRQCKPDERARDLTLWTRSSSVFMSRIALVSAVCSSCNASSNEGLMR